MVMYTKRSISSAPVCIQGVGVFFLNQRSEHELHERSRCGSRESAGCAENVLRVAVCNIVLIKSRKIALRRGRIEMSEGESRHPDFVAHVPWMADVETRRRILWVPEKPGRDPVFEQRQPLE